MKKQSFIIGGLATLMIGGCLIASKLVLREEILECYINNEKVTYYTPTFGAPLFKPTRTLKIDQKNKTIYLMDRFGRLKVDEVKIVDKNGLESYFTAGVRPEISRNILQRSQIMFNDYLKRLSQYNTNQIP